MTARAHLNGHEEGFAGIALCAFKAAQIETWFVRLDAGQLHRLAASGAVQNADLRNAKKRIGLSGMDDAPFGPGGSATLSVIDCCPWWVGDRTSISFGFHTYWSILLAFKKSGRSRPERLGGARRRKPGRGQQGRNGHRNHQRFSHLIFSNSHLKAMATNVSHGAERPQ
jgi:hypothetical protein